MRTLLIRFGLFAFVSVGLLTSTGRAQTLAFTVRAPEVGGRQDFRSSLGLFFTLNAPLTISSLGYWDDNLDGVDGSLQVAIFTSSGTPAIVSGASLTFTNTIGTLTGTVISNQLNSNSTSSGRPGQFRLANLPAPVVLTAGDYALVAWGYTFANQSITGVNVGPAADVNTFGGILTFVGSRYDSTNTPGAFPTASDGSAALYLSATFSPDTITAIPEPADFAIALAAAALLGAGMARRRQRRPVVS